MSYLALSDGDFVKIDYSVWRVADNQLLETTNEQLAKENGIYSEGSKYAPVLVVIGKRDVVKGVDEALKKMSVNEEKEIVVEPKDAFGERDPSLVKVIALSEFRKRDIDPYPGMVISLDGVEAVVKSVNSGRVIVDENNPLAGESLKYKIKVTEKLDKDEDKIKAIAEKLGITPSSISIDPATKTAKIEFNTQEKTAEYEAKKSSLPTYVFTYMDSIEKVEIKDTYTRPKKEEQK